MRLNSSTRARNDLDSAISREIPVPSQSSVIVVGAGLAGLTIASVVAPQANVEILEKSAGAGGVWWSTSNALSRVNSSEPSYRIPGVARTAHNTNHSHQHEILDDVRRLIEQHGLTRHLHTRCEVRRVLTSEDGGHLVGGLQDTRTFRTACEVLVLATNRRLGKPRSVQLQGEDAFSGEVCNGVAGISDQLEDWTGREVVILGMGAFAIEHVRNTTPRHAVPCHPTPCHATTRPNSTPLHPMPSHTILHHANPRPTLTTSYTYCRCDPAWSAGLRT